MDDSGSLICIFPMGHYAPTRECTTSQWAQPGLELNASRSHNREAVPPPRHIHSLSSVLLLLALSRTINFQYLGHPVHPILPHLSQIKPEPFPLIRF